MRNVTSASVGHGESDEAHVDAAVAKVAARQQGVVTTGQLRAAGLGRGAIAHRVKTGRLTPWHRGVYLVGPMALPYSAEVAALLTCGVERSALSHRTAAAIWGLAPRPATVEITIAGQVRARPGVRVHRTTHLEATTREGLRVTTPTRTLEDLAATLPQRELERLIQEARAQNLTLLPSRRLRALDTEPRITRSEAERRLLDLIARAGLPRPHTNVKVGPYEVDLLWPQQRLIVEVDGYAFHGSRQAFERDRARDAHLVAMNHRVMRATWRQIVHHHEALIARFAAALASATP